MLLWTSSGLHNASPRKGAVFAIQLAWTIAPSERNIPKVETVRLNMARFRDLAFW